MMTIYSVGDVWYLGKVLDAIAMVTGADGGLKQASAVAALLGVIIICFQSVIRNQGINIQHMVVCYIIYMMCFGFTTSVAIESAYSDKQVIQKDNVPYGPAVMGYVVSQLGYKLTRKMEQAFQDIDDNQKMTNQGAGGYLNALYLIENLGRIAEDGTIARAINAVDPDFQSNFLRYTSECTLKGMYYGSSRGGMDWQILQTKGVWDAIFFDSDWYTTEFRNHGVSEVLNCTDAHGKLKKQWDNAIVELQSGKASDEVKNIAMRLGQCNSKGECSNQSDFLIKTDSDALKTLFNAQTKAQDFVLAGYADNLIKTGLADGFTFMGNANSAAMMLQAINQRQTQWAAEQNMFLKSMRPMMSFVEGFFYAIAPFASIILMLGLLGLNIFFKYLILLVWVQLWLPVMSIANMFISVRANAFLSNLPIPKDGSSSTVSLYVYETAIDGVREYIASGAMFMAATPLLTFIIISGSAYAMTSLTGRMSGGDFVNEKMVSPDIASPAATLGMKSRFNGNPNLGYQAEGFITQSMSIGESLNNVQASLDQGISQNSHTVQDSIGYGENKISASTVQNAWQHSNIDKVAGQTVDSTGYSFNQIKSQLQKDGVTKGLSTAEEDAVVASVGASFAGNGLVDQQHFKKGLSENAQHAFDEAIQKSKGWDQRKQMALQAVGESALGHAISDTKGETHNSSVGTTFTDSGAKMDSFAKQYSNLDELRRSLGTDLKASVLDWVGQFGQRDEGALNKHLASILDKYDNDGSIRYSADRKAESQFRDVGQYRDAYSKAIAILESNNNEAKLEAINGIVNGVGYTPNTNFEPNRNAGIVDQNALGPNGRFNKNNYESNNNKVSDSTKGISVDSIKKQHETDSGKITTDQINGQAEMEQKKLAENRKEATSNIRSSKNFKPLSFTHTALNGAVVANSLSHLLQTTEDTIINKTDWALSAGKKGFIEQSQIYSDKFKDSLALGNSDIENTLSDYLGASSILGFGVSNGEWVGADDIYNKIKDSDSKISYASGLQNKLVDQMAKNIQKNSNIDETEAKEKAQIWVKNLDLAISFNNISARGDLLGELRKYNN